MSVPETGATTDSGAGQAEPGQPQPRPRRRQARGERRIRQLLDAAAAVFCREGYGPAGTSAIAREAGVSPGTLYQFFPNKEAIALELGERFTQQLRETHGQVFTQANALLPLDELLDAIVDPLIDFNCHNPAFLALMKAPDAPGPVTDEHEVLHLAFQERTAELIALRRPELPADLCERTAAFAFALFKAGLETAMAQEGAERDAYFAELKTALHRYLAPVLGTEATPAPAGARRTPSA